MIRQILLLIFIEALIFIPSCMYIFSVSGVAVYVPDGYTLIVPEDLQLLLPLGDSTALILMCMRLVYFVSCVFLMIYGALSLSRDAASGKIEFLLVRPTSRSAIFTQRLIMGLITVVFSWAAMYTLGAAALYAAKPGASLLDADGYEILAFSLRALGIEAMLFLLSYMWSSICRTRTSAVCASLLCFFGAYTLGIFPQVVEKLWITSYFSPYHFAFDGTLNWIKPTIAGVLALVSLVIGAVVYKRSQFYEM